MKFNRKETEWDVREREAKDAAPATARCALCPDWFVEDTVAECRKAFDAHRRKFHPGLAAGNGHATDGVEALARMDAGERQRPAEIGPVEEPSASPVGVVEAAPRAGRVDGADAKRAPKGKWKTREQVVEAIQAHAAEHGEPPTALGAKSLYSAIRTLGWTWPDAIEAAGFERPVRGKTRTPRGTPRKPRVVKTVEGLPVEPEPEPEPPPTRDLVPVEPPPGSSQAPAEHLTPLDELDTGQLLALYQTIADTLRGRRSSLYGEANLITEAIGDA